MSLAAYIFSLYFVVQMPDPMSLYIDEFCYGYMVDVIPGQREATSCKEYDVPYWGDGK